jgi:hypothetical protein
MAVRVVQGFGIVSFTCKEEKVKVTLSGSKDDIRAGEGDIADVLESLELHSTAADTSAVSVALRNSADAEQSTSYEFTVASFGVKQDEIKMVLQAQTSDVGMSVLGALGTHAAAEGEQRLVELTMQRPD